MYLSIQAANGLQGHLRASTGIWHKSRINGHERRIAHGQLKGVKYGKEYKQEGEGVSCIGGGG